MTRPARLVFVTGTGTEVGKTWWTAAVARALRATGTAVAARKPAQSGAPGDETDAEVLGRATGEAADDVCPPHRTYTVAWAPPMAAEALGAPPFTVADLATEIRWPGDVVEVGLVEGAGGPRSPIAADGDNVDLAAALAPDLVVVVADAGLGTINAARLAVAPFTEVLPGTAVVVALNRFGADPLHELNRRHLVERAGLDVVTDPAALAERLRAGS